MDTHDGPTAHRLFLFLYIPQRLGRPCATEQERILGVAVSSIWHQWLLPGAPCFPFCFLSYTCPCPMSQLAAFPRLHCAHRAVSLSYSLRAEGRVRARRLSITFSMRLRWTYYGRLFEAAGSQRPNALCFRHCWPRGVFSALPSLPWRAWHFRHAFPRAGKRMGVDGRRKEGVSSDGYDVDGGLALAWWQSCVGLAYLCLEAVLQGLVSIVARAC